MGQQYRYRVDQVGWISTSNAQRVYAYIAIFRVRRREFRTYPNYKSKQKRSSAMREALKEWDQAICLLNPEVALRISSKVVQAIMARAYVAQSVLTWNVELIRYPYPQRSGCA